MVNIAEGGETTYDVQTWWEGQFWGETRFYNHSEWNVGLLWPALNNIQKKGTNISEISYGFALIPAKEKTFVDGHIYGMSWYQPTYATSYAADTLRRYSGAVGTGGDAVRAYCVGAITIADADYPLVTAGDDTGKVSLQSAYMLAFAFHTCVVVGLALF